MKTIKNILLMTLIVVSINQIKSAEAQEQNSDKTTSAQTAADDSLADIFAQTDEEQAQLNMPMEPMLATMPTDDSHEIRSVVREALGRIPIAYFDQEYSVSGGLPRSWWPIEKKFRSIFMLKNHIDPQSLQGPKSNITIQTRWQQAEDAWNASPEKTAFENYKNSEIQRVAATEAAAASTQSTEEAKA